MILWGVSVVVLSLVLSFVRLAIGPTLMDRVLAMNIFGTLMTVCICLISYLSYDEAYLDIALLYGLLNFITTIGLLRYLEGRNARASE